MKVAKDLAARGKRGAVIELVGDVGAGKTTFTRGLAKGLGVVKPVTSPSYTISRSYAFSMDGEEQILDHYDFYRLGDPGLMTETLAESIASGHLVVVEWADSASDVLPSERLTLRFALNEDGSREIEMTQGVRSEGISEINESPVSATMAREGGGINLYLDTSGPTTLLRINDREYTWESGKALAEKLLGYIHERLAENGADWKDITGITYMSGPGSFTGLRIGAAVVNTLAHELGVPLYNHRGERLPIILPEYGRAANITKPKK
jgi:tRNA threonylcarbamoyladenosine biosynthesis protein TsaE